MVSGPSQACLRSMLLLSMTLDHEQSIFNLGCSFQAVRLGGGLTNDAMVGCVRLLHVSHLFVAIHQGKLMMIQSICQAALGDGNESRTRGLSEAGGDHFFRRKREVCDKEP